jgi:S1-C subfamily serine protease
VEVVLIRLRPPAGERGRTFPFVRIGDSSRLRIGQLAYTLGNAFRSISEDQQVSLAVGAVSGSYVLTEPRNESHYRGPAIETTAAVNDGMDGGPLVDGNGDVVGLISLNFSRNRWLGTAVPVNMILPTIAEELGSFSDRLERFPAFLGIELRPAVLATPRGEAQAPGSPEALGPVVIRVQLGSPAASAGFKEGDRVVSWNGAPVATGRDFRALFGKARPGERVKIGIERGKDRRELEAALWGSY